MKTLALLFALALSSISHAADLTCHVNADEQKLTDSYDLTITGDRYEISHYGHSRNTYDAVYTLTSHSATRVGWMGTLEKSQDKSTWHDMPATLYVRYVMISAPAYVIEGLDANPVWFSASECEAAPVNNECPAGTHPGHCPSRNCGSCL
jgi:hypothetical protein